MLKPALLSEEEKRLPYAKYYEIPVEGGRPEDERRLSEPLPAEKTLPVEEALRLILSGEEDRGEDLGYCIFSDGRTYTAVKEFLPGIEPKMMDWYFKWMGTRPSGIPAGCGNLRYKIWCPPCHWDLADLSGEPATHAMICEQLDLEKKVERIQLHIRRFPLSVIGVTEQMEKQFKEEGKFIALECGYSVKDQPGGLGINYFRPAEGGCEWISRSWGGYTIQNGKIVRIPVEPSPSLEAMRTELIHNLVERRHLSKFLPQLYEEYGGKSYREDY